MRMLLGMTNVIVEALSIHTKSRYFFFLFFFLPLTIKVWGTYVKEAQASKVIQNVNGLPARTN